MSLCNNNSNNEAFVWRYRVRRYRGAGGGTGRRKGTNEMSFKYRFKKERLWLKRMLAGKEFQVEGTATENARQASLFYIRRIASSGAPDERSDLGGTCL